MSISEQNKQTRLNICKRLQELRPDAEIKFDKYTEKVAIYSSSVVDGKAVTHKDFRTIYVKDNPEKLAKRFLTKEEARQAILEHMEVADSKAMNAARRLIALEKELGFYTDYTMEGDTYGIHTDYSTITFEISKFHFQYNLEDLREKVRLEERQK